jgi:hypothetical protein
MAEPPSGSRADAQSEINTPTSSGRAAHGDAPRHPVRAGSGPAVSDMLLRSAKAALARWVLHKRRRHHAAGGLSAKDEATHAADGRRRFAEEYTFVAVQATSAVLARLEWLPGRGGYRVWLMVFRDGELFTIPGLQAVGRTRGLDRWRAAGLELDCVTPFKQWTIRYTGRLHRARASGEGDDDPKPDDLRCSLDLTFLSDVPAFEPGADDDPDLIARRLGEATWDASLLRSVRRVQSRGYVQIGSVHGTVALGGEILPIRAAGLRQHIWGVRDWAASDSAFQCFAAFEDGRRVWLHNAVFPFVTLEGGFVHDGQALVPVRAFGASLEHRPERAPRFATLDVEYGEDRIGIEAEMLRDVALSVDGRGAVSLGLFRLSNGAGWGVWVGQRRLLPRPAVR